MSIKNLKKIFLCKNEIYLKLIKLILTYCSTKIEKKFHKILQTPKGIENKNDGNINSGKMAP